ncbi:MAG: anti-sigma factor family protein [Planctomycetota bacterium]|jgi:hypothetical protein
MNCEKCKELLVAYLEDVLERSDKQAIESHLNTCPPCRAEANEIISLRDRLVTNGKALAQTNLEDKVLNRIVREQSSKLRKVSKSNRQIQLWRMIMKSRITKLAAAAAIIVAVSIFGWVSSHDGSGNGTKSLTYFSLISQVRAAEEKLFYQDAITHIVNEIVVFASSKNIAIRQEGESDAEESVETLNSFLEYNWLPMCSVRANGHLRFNQLQLPAGNAQPYTIVDESWYDSATGNFVRVLKCGQEVFFANSYDGRFVYNLETSPDGSTRVIKEQVTDDFTPPRNPAEFLGITAGLPSGIEEESVSPIQEIREGTLADGAPVRVVKAGFGDAHGELNAYWLFKVREDNSTIAEMEFIIADQPQLLIRRVLSETVDAPSVSWSLTDLPEEVPGGQERVKPVVKPDMVIPNVSVQHMLERADFETYVFGENPSWAAHREIVDCIDPPSPGHRMFFIACRADDGRHVVLVQSHTYNKMLGNLAKKGQLVYTSPNGFKVWGGGPDKWYSQIILSSARATIKDPPSEDRVGYVLESPAGTFPALAVNGPLTDEELHSLVDSLVAAREYQGE